jgi:hypothetical protein
MRCITNDLPVPPTASSTHPADWPAKSAAEVGERSSGSHQAVPRHVEEPVAIQRNTLAEWRHVPVEQVQALSGSQRSLPDAGPGRGAS